MTPDHTDWPPPGGRVSAGGEAATSPPAPPLGGEGSKRADGSVAGQRLLPLAPPSRFGKGVGGLGGAIAAACALALAGCRREERNYHPAPPFAGAVRFDAEYRDNAFALSEGKKLFAAFNCVYCHADGGGAIGPPLMDDRWVYGYEPGDIFETISKGRPNGMPAFGGKVPDYQIWQLVAYVRSMSGLASSSAATGRGDHMRGRPAESETPAANPVVAPPPDAGDAPR